MRRKTGGIKNALQKTPALRTGKNSNVATINMSATALLGLGYVAFVKGEDGSISLVHIEVPEGTHNVVRLITPLSGANRVYHNRLLENGKKYICRWDDINERLVIVEGKKKCEHCNTYDPPIGTCHCGAR